MSYAEKLSVERMNLMFMRCRSDVPRGIRSNPAPLEVRIGGSDRAFLPRFDRQRTAGS